MSIILNKNIDLLSSNYLSTNDVLLKPTFGILKSRKEADTNLSFIYNSPMDTVASSDLFDALLKTNQNAVSCRFKSEFDRLAELNKYKDESNYWFTVGADIKDYNMLQDFCQSKSLELNISVDVAHGATSHLCKIYKLYSDASWCKRLMSGTVATSEAALEVFNAGCTHIRIGIGPGSACSTRVVTGCGVPNLSAVFQIWLGFRDLTSLEDEDYPILIADGGIKSSGDIAKYLSAGADAVMIGNLLSKTTESGAWKKNTLFYTLFLLTFKRCFLNKIYYKRYRGQASKEFQLDKKGFVSGAPEGVQGPKQHPLYDYKTFYNQTVNALCSTVSYTGLRSISELNPESVEFIKITSNGWKESQPHLLN